MQFSHLLALLSGVYDLKDQFFPIESNDKVIQHISTEHGIRAGQGNRFYVINRASLDLQVYHVGRPLVSSTVVTLGDHHPAWYKMKRINQSLRHNSDLCP